MAGRDCASERAIWLRGRRALLRKILPRSAIRVVGGVRGLVGLSGRAWPLESRLWGTRRRILTSDE